MREIMVDNEATVPDPTNTSVISEEVEVLNDFQKVFSVRDLLGVGAFGVVLLVKNKIT